jgi:hypothetical protein
MLTPLVITDQIIGDNFGFNLKFPYNVSGFRVVLTLKKALEQLTADAEKIIAAVPATTADADGFYNVTIALTASQTAALDAESYFFDIVTTDLSGVVEHIVHPESTVQFLQSVTDPA